MVKRVLLTGGLGYIGSHTAVVLAEAGFNVVLYDNLSNSKRSVLDRLETITEQAVMEAVYNLGHEITIILIAHRLSTVKACDTIILLENGSVKAQGAYEELAHISNLFSLVAACEPT